MVEKNNHKDGNNNTNHIDYDVFNDMMLKSYDNKCGDGNCNSISRGFLQFRVFLRL